MAQSRDQAGRYAAAGAGNAGGAAAAVHTPAGAASPASISSSTDPAQRGAASSVDQSSSDPAGLSSDPAAIVNESDVWGNLHSATSALVDRPVGGSGGGSGDLGGGANKELIPDPDYEEGFGKLRFDAPDLGREAGKAFSAERTAQAAGRAAGRDAALRAGGYSGPEGPGTHAVFAPGGRAGHGADIDPGGIPGPGGDTPGGDDWGGVPVSSGPRDWSPAGGGSAAAGDFGGVE